MATDAEIRAAGFKYVPQQKYLLNPFKLPTAPEEEPVINQGIVNTNAFTGGGGDGFSVYNPDPNSIVNRNYQPNYDYRQFVDGYDPNLSATMNMKMMEVDPNYKGADYYNKPPSKMEGLMNLIPYAGSFVRGANFLGNQISPYLPVNRRSILENELGGQGIMVNDIGQIVQGEGDYNTAENVMAGYNAGKITQETIDKRKGTIEKTFADKYDLTKSEIDSIKAGDITKDIIDKTKGSELVDRYGALDEFENTLDSTNILTDKIYDFEEDEKEKKKKDTIVGRYITKRNEKKAAKAAKDAGIAADASSTDTGGGYTGTPGGNTGSGNFANIDNSGKNYGPYSNNSSSSGGGGGNPYGGGPGGVQSGMPSSSPTNVGNPFGYMDGGRAGYFFGGRVKFKAGGRTDAESQYGADSAGSYDSSQNRSDRQQSYGGDNDTKQPAKVNTIDTSGSLFTSPEININYTDPKNYASLRGRIYNKNILDNDNINVDGTLSGEIGPVNYGVDFTDQGITGTNLTAGNFNADIDANKNYSIGYANNYNGIDYGTTYDSDGNLMFNAGVKFKHGGLASIL